VEAISNGVPAFRKPESRNASITLMLMGSLLGGLFLGVSLLAHHLHPYPSADETVISQMGRAIYGGGPIYVVLQFATAAILILAANTAYADFPRLSSIIAKDGFLPRQFANRGDRLVFSNGILFLAAASAALIVAFGGITNALIPLYAVGVFTAFTLSQVGMVRHHRRVREPNWRRGMVINAVGATATFLVLIIVAVTKFAVGAWLPIVVIPMIILLFRGIRHHYDRVAAALRSDPTAPIPEAETTVVVLVGRVNTGVRKALGFASSLRPERLIALSIVFEPEDAELLQHEWEAHGIQIPLKIVESPYRELVRPVLRYIEDLQAEHPDDIVAVVIPEFVVGKWWEHILHNQSALMLKARLLFREGTVVASVPYHLRPPDRVTVHVRSQERTAVLGPSTPSSPVALAPQQEEEVTT
jgi:hypothetical protein